MKGSKLIGQIDSFNNKQEIGLFTFYIETSNQNSTISLNDQTHQHKQKIHKNIKTINQQNYETRKISQYRKNNKPQRRLKTLQACTNSYYLVEKNEQILEKKDKSINSPFQFDMVRELLNAKRQNNKKLLQELLIKNQVDSQILDRFSKKKGLINPDKLINSKKCSLNGFPKHAGPFKSGYLSNVAKKMSKSFQKTQKISKNLSEQLTCPKQKLNIHQIKAFNDQLDIEFKLQQQKFRPNLFPFYKKRYSSHLKETQLSQMHPSSNDSLIQKLKNTNKLLKIKEKSHQKIPFDISKTFRQQREDSQATVSQSKKKVPKQINTSSDKSLVDKLSRQNFSQNQTYLPRQRINFMQKYKKSFHEQRALNCTETKKRNSLVSFQNFSTLEKISLSKKKKTGGSLQFSRKTQNYSDMSKNSKNLSQNMETKKDLLMIVKKVKEKYVNI